MKFLFWIALAGILYTYLGYPVAIWIMARLRPRPWRSSPMTPSVSVVLAVHNGAALLPSKIRHLLSLDYPNLKEIILVSDGSSDGTAEILAGQRDARIKTIVLKEHGGKAVAVNAGMAAATGEILLFMDIRPEVAPGGIQRLVSNFADPKVGCVSGRLILRRGSHDAVSSAVGGLYWRYEQWTRKCEALCDSPVGVYGGFYAVRRELAKPQPAGIILDDMFQPLAIIRQGYRSVIDSEACVFDMWPESLGGEFHRKVRTLAGNFQLIQMAPWTLTTQNRVLFQFVSHKLTRLAAPYLQVLLLVSMLALSRDSMIFAALAAMQILSLTLAVVGMLVRIPILGRIAAPASALLALNAAAAVGLYRFLFTRGPLWKIWTTKKPTEQVATPSAQRIPSEPVTVAPVIEMSHGFLSETAQQKEA